MLGDLLSTMQDFIVDNSEVLVYALIIMSIALLVLLIAVLIQAGKIKALRKQCQDTSKLDGLNSQLEEANNTNATLSQQLEEANNTIATLNQQLDGLKQHSDALKELNQSLNIEIDNTKTENEQLKQQLEAKKPTKKAKEKVSEEETEVVEEDHETIEIKQKNSAHEGFILKYDRLKGDWAIKKKGATRATRRADTKEEAVKIAKELSKKYNATLAIHKKDGKFQKQ